MTAETLAYGRRVIWQGLLAEIIDICWRVDRTSVQLRFAIGGRRLVWVDARDLEAIDGDD